MHKIEACYFIVRATLIVRCWCAWSTGCICETEECICAVEEKTGLVFGGELCVCVCDPNICYSEEE